MTENMGGSERPPSPPSFGAPRRSRGAPRERDPLAGSGYYAPVDPDVLKRERAKARALRDSQWWKRRISTGICHYCRREVGVNALTMDHVVPLGRGGASTRGNVVPSCKDCNNRKKHLLPIEWQDYLDSLGRDET